MNGTIAYKIGETTRIPVQARLANVLLPLGGLTIKVKLQVDAAIITLITGAGIGIGPSAGEFWYEVTPANLATLGNPDQVFTVINIWNADNTLVMDGDAVVSVRL